VTNDTHERAGWTRTPLRALFGIEHPIFQGPFGGGNSTPKLAAAVSNAGALGAYGAVGLAPDEIARVVADIRARTSRPFAVNLWVPIAGQDDQHASDVAFARAIERGQPARDALGIAPPLRVAEREVVNPWRAYEAQLEALLRAGPPVFSFVMGAPSKEVIAAVRARGAKSVATATTVDEARALEAVGVDAIVLSGLEAGGHRGSFLRPVEESLFSMLTLVSQVRRAVRVPIVAAGGITDGATLAAAMIAGADGAQIGTAFLASDESGAPEAHKRLLGTPASAHTKLTRAITGRFARGIVNPLIETLEAPAEPVLSYPAQSDATRDIRAAAAQQDRAEWMALWAGQNAPLARRMPAADLVARLCEECERALDRDR
jgi:nitronate monooxygenase